MAIKINTSFKETDEDMKIYLEIQSHSDKSSFIKDAVKFYIKYRHMETMIAQEYAKSNKNRDDTV